MTIFDSIKYPLSEPPTMGEIEQIPLDIIMYCNLSRKVICPPQEEIKRLKLIIEKYNTDECEVSKYWKKS